MGAIVGAGVLLRLRVYLFNRALWNDEARLANNFVQRSLSSLLTRPLDYDQGAPLGFVALNKLMTMLLGSTDYVLRLLAFLSGILVLLPAYALAQQLFKTALGRLAFMAMVSLSPVLIYYASEFKQYSSDVLIALLLLWVALAYWRWRGGLWILTGAGCVALWLSHPSIFVLAGIGLALWLAALRARSKEGWQALAAVGAAWALSFGLDYLFAVRSMAGNTYLTEFWRQGYAPLPFQSPGALKWYASSLLGLVFMAFQQKTPLPVEAQPGWFLYPNCILAALVILGAAAATVRARKVALIAGAIVLANLVVSAFGLYPFRNRLILYLVPLVYLAAAMLFEALAVLAPPRVAWLAAPLAVIPVALLGVTAASMWLAPNDFANMKGALQYVEAHHQRNDYLSINHWAEAPLDFYGRFYDLSGLRLAEPIRWEDDAWLYLARLCQQDTRGRTWVVHLSDPAGQVKLVKGLKQVRPVLAAWESDVAGVYLFDFSGPGVCQPAGQARATAAPQADLAVAPDRIVPGQCATLKWHAEGVREVYLGEEGVAGHGERQVCPARTTYYALRAVAEGVDVVRPATLWVAEQ